MDSIKFSRTSSRSMKLTVTPATAKVAFVFVPSDENPPQSPNPVLHVIHLTGAWEESLLLIDQVRDGLADICGADYVKKLHISNVNCDGDKHSYENMFVATISVSFPADQDSRLSKPIEETFTESSSQLLSPSSSLSRESRVRMTDVSSQQQSLLNDTSSIKSHYESKEIPPAGSPPSAPRDEGQNQQENDSTLNGCSVDSVQNAIEGESLLNGDDSMATSSLDEDKEICTIPVQASDHHVLQSSMPLQPQTLESNYNPSVDVCREGDGYTVEVLFHGYRMVAELDTGSPYTIISEETLTSIFESTPKCWSAQLQQRKEPSTIKELEAYNGGVINIREQIDVILTRDKRKVNTKVLIVEGAPVPLLIGKDVLPQLGYTLVERVSDSADECRHYQVIRPVSVGPDKVTRYLGRSPKFLNTCNNEAGLCHGSVNRKNKVPTKESLLQSDDVLIDMCFD